MPFVSRSSSYHPVTHQQLSEILETLKKIQELLAEIRDEQLGANR